MFGLINNSFREFIKYEFGDEFWDKVCSSNPLGKDEANFMRMRETSDQTTYSLVEAAAHLIRLPEEVILEQFGIYWIDKVADEKFSEIMAATGQDFFEFIGNLNEMHHGISSNFLGYSPPKFEMYQCCDNLYIITYQSVRAGLTPFVTGLLRGLANYFGNELNIKNLETEVVGSSEASKFYIEVFPSTKDE